MGFFHRKNIRFNGKKEIETKVKNQTKNVISRRFKILMASVVAVGVILLIRLYITQIVEGEYYHTKLIQYNTNIFTTDTFRGSIYDRNYERLVYNKTINCATYYSVKNIQEEEIDLMIKFLVDNVKIDISSITDREKKDYLIKKDKEFVDSLLTEEELKSEDAYNLQLQYITEDMLKEKLTDYDIKYYKLYFAIKNCTSGSVVLLDNLSVKEASLIGENSSLLRGIRVTNDWSREYAFANEFKQVLGKVTNKKEGLPATQRDILRAQDYNNDSRVGISGLEKEYESLLAGNNALYSIDYDADGNPIVETVSNGSKGQNLRLTIDWEIQQKLGKEIEAKLKSTSNKYNNEIFITMMDPNNGEIIAMAGKRKTEDGEIIDYAAGNYLSAFEIGSTFKGTTIYTAYKYDLIQKGEVMYDFRDAILIKGTKAKDSWKPLGYIDDIDALSQSSNVYMFHIAIRLGKGNYVRNQPLSIDPAAFDTFRLCAGELGLGVKTGIDIPNEALGYRGPTYRRLAGNLLDFAIGQYDTYTPVQMAQYVSTIANGGKRIQPHLFMNTFSENSDGVKVTGVKHQTKILDDVSNEKLAFERIQAGFRKGVTSGLASSINGYYEPAGKTGTAQVLRDGVEYTNRAFVAYAPYDQPQIAVSCMSPAQSGNGTSHCNSLTKLALTEYFDKYGVKKDK